MKKIIRNIEIYFLLRKVKSLGVFKFGYRDQCISFHSPQSYPTDWEQKKILALIRMGKIKPTDDTHAIPTSRERANFEYKIVYA